MQDPMSGVLKLLEYVHEKWPGMANVHRSAYGIMPPAVKIMGITEESVDRLVRPTCKKIAGEYDFELEVDYKERGNLDWGNREEMPVCYIYVVDHLGIYDLYLQKVFGAHLTPVDDAIGQLRKHVYTLEIVTA